MYSITGGHRGANRVSRIGAHSSRGAEFAA
jgi:hypothetical protein